MPKRLFRAVENQKADFKPAYDTDMSIKDKINEIVTKIYGGKGVNYTPKAQKQIARLEELGLDKKLYVWQRRSIHCLTTQTFGQT